MVWSGDSCSDHYWAVSRKGLMPLITTPDQWTIQLDSTRDCQFEVVRHAILLDVSWEKQWFSHSPNRFGPLLDKSWQISYICSMLGWTDELSPLIWNWVLGEVCWNKRIVPRWIVYGNQYGAWPLFQSWPTYGCIDVDSEHSCTANQRNHIPSSKVESRRVSMVRGETISPWDERRDLGRLGLRSNHSMGP